MAGVTKETRAKARQGLKDNVMDNYEPPFRGGGAYVTESSDEQKASDRRTGKAAEAKRRVDRQKRIDAKRQKKMDEIHGQEEKAFLSGR